MAATARLILTIREDKKEAFLKMLELFDFVKVEDQDAFLKQFIENAPADVPLSEADIITEVMAGRYGSNKQ